MHTCQHLEIRNQDTFIIALTPPPDQSSLSNPAGSLDAENLGKRKIEADRFCIAFLIEIHELFIRTVRIDKGNFFSICREKSWKNADICLGHYFKNSLKF